MSQTIVNVELKVELEVIECPICMDEIEGEKNKITTNCGHCFHTSCLMTNVAHNGFNCPYCRTAMAEEPAEDNSDDEYDEFSIDESEEEGPDYNDHVLRGARWLFQRADGEEADDDSESDESESEPEEVVEEQVDRPSVDYIVENLIQRGVTMADLVKSILLVDHNEFQNESSFERGDSELFGKFRIIISNYRPTPVPEPEPEPEPISIIEEVGNPIIRYETSHYKSLRLRQINSVSEDEDSVLEEDSNLVSINISIDEKLNQYCDTYYSLERMNRYEKNSELIQMDKISEKKEEQSSKMPFSFQMKGTCRC